MLTQQDIVDRLNQLTLRYNLTWFDIKFDADRAISKINNFMGTKYPKLSQYLTTQDATYTITMYTYTDAATGALIFPDDPILKTTTIEALVAAGTVVNRTVEYEIIPEEYFHSVIIPFIAMEVLARDEEFTTIYNKYTTEVEDGLYHMFQKEFNRVPFEFRQNPDQGVFFASDTALGRQQHNTQRDLPIFKFRVNYFVNNQDIVLDQAFISDPRAYTYDQEATLLLWDTNTKVYSSDYSKVYTFQGWTRDRARTTTGLYTTAATIKMREDLNLYAIWSSASTLTISLSGEVSIDPLYKANLQRLVIPDYVSGIKVTSVASNFATNAPLLKTIVLPKYLTTIKQNAFNTFTGTSIILPELEKITIETNAFAATPNLTSIIIPANVTTIQANAFPVVLYKNLTINARILQNNKPSTWYNGWYAASTTNYTVDVKWGYNG